MRAAKIIFLVSLLLGNCTPPFVLIALSSLLFPGNRHMLLICLYLLVVGVLIFSFFSNERRKRILENGVLILAAMFYFTLNVSESVKNSSALQQLPFLLSFGLFLYFKILAFFDRKKTEGKIEN